MQENKRSWFLITKVTVLLVLIILYTIVRLYYLFGSPLQPFEQVCSVIFFLSEAFILFHSFFFFLDIVREHFPEAPYKEKVPGADASVAILIPARHEPKDIIQNTLLTCTSLAYENKKVYLLDDSTIEKYKQEARELSESLGVELFTRSNNKGAKAGMINQALNVVKEKYVAIFDADQNPMPGFLDLVIPVLEADEKLAFMQTPQFYSNIDASPVAMAAHNQQAIFYEYICVGKTMNKAMFCCGTNVVFRRTALEDVGRFVEDTVTEDMATSLKLHANGWKSSFIHKAYTFGMAPEDLASYFTQQQRWSLGTSQIFRKLLKLFITDRKALTPSQWVEYFLSTTYYFIGWPYFFLILGPVMYVFFNLRSFYIDQFAYALTFVPLFILSNIVFYQSMITKKYKLSNMFKVQMLTMMSIPVYLVSSINGLFNLDKKGFRVTPKGGGRNVPFRSLWPQLLLFCILLFSFFWGLSKLYYSWDPVLAINMFWIGFQSVLLSGIFHFNKK